MVLVLGSILLNRFLIMGRHEKEKRKAFEKRRKMTQKKKNKFSKDTIVTKNNSNNSHEIQQLDETEEYTSTCSSSSNDSHVTEKSPFHISSESGYSAKQPTMKPKEFSWEKAESTDPLLVRWQEFKMLKTRLNRIKNLKF